MAKIHDCLQAHLNIAKAFILCYIVFTGCFTFPFWSERFPLDFMKAYLVIAGYGIIALGFSAMYGPGKEKAVYFQTAVLTMIGLLCRNFLELGEASNAYNFTVLNIFLYLLVTPVFTAAAYYFMAKLMLKKDDCEEIEDETGR